MKFVDEGIHVSKKMKELADGQPKPRGLLAIDPICLSCSKNQGEIISKFKMACLSYAPSSVIHRNIEFSREQLLVFRKFLMGQCSKIIHLKEPYKSLGFSTKRIFDDIYLFLKEVNEKCKKPDPLNDLPKETFEEVTSKYWNLIYKQSGSLKPDAAQVLVSPFSARDTENDFPGPETYDFGVNPDRFNIENMKNESQEKRPSPEKLKTAKKRRMVHYKNGTYQSYGTRRLQINRTPQDINN